MASSMLTAEALSASASKEVDVDKALKTTLHSCANDPDFAIICDFLQKFAKDLSLDVPNFKLLLQWLTKTDEVSPQLRDMQIKLLRKTRKTVHEKSWESALSKFCFTYSAQDGWEIERFGYKNSSVKVKLRILRELLECQFERNTKFRAKILTLSADSLRSKPIGRDRQGHAYWVTQDNDCNIRIYQEHLDEEIWQVVATNRDEFVNLISRLRGSEVVMPCKDIGIVDEDTTSSSSNLASDSLKKVPPPEEKDDSQEDEQKVPKLSIKIFHGNDLKETTNAKDLGKGEEELASEEDAKLLKKSTASSDTIESDEEEFEEVEEEHDDESDSELESEDEINNKQINLNKKETEQKFKETLKSKDENKKVKPLLISQNKVLSNESSSPCNASKKRVLNQVDSSWPHRSENQQEKIVKKSRPSLLDSNRSKAANSYEELDEEGCKQSTLEDIEVEEELEEEDIDSAAAEEDENEEKLFDDYDDDDDEVGEEISDPILRVSGEGSGKDCDVENYLYCIDYDLQVDGIPTFSEIIVEDLCFIRGEGCGIECLVGNDKANENNLNTIEIYHSEKLKTIVENKSKDQSEVSLPESKTNTSSLLEDTESTHLGTSKQITDEAKNLAEDSNENNKKYDEISDQTSTKDEKVEKEINPTGDVSQINGDKKTINEALQEKQSVLSKTTDNLPLLSDSKKIRYEKILEASCEEDNQESKNILKLSNVDTTVKDVSTLQAHANKMSALASLKKELRESKQKLLEKKLPQANESSIINSSCPSIYNRKRRLTEQQKTPLPNSESEIELNSENTEDVTNDKEHKNDDIDKDVGGKRLKMRPKQTNTELRKKIEAQKIAANDETTSSSGGEEELVNTNKCTKLTKQSPDSVKIKSEKKVQSNELKKDSNLKGDKDSTKSDEQPRPTTLSQQLSPPLKKTVHNVSTKVKPTLAEVLETKLRRSTEKVQNDLDATNNDNNMIEPDTAKKQISSPKKSPITKPLKKSLLTQLSQEQSDDDAVPPKRSNSQDLNTSISINVKSFESDYKSSGEDTILKTDDKIKITPERQRKRRSSEETVHSESAEEPEAKKEVTIVEKNVTRKHAKNIDIIKEDVMKKETKVLKNQTDITTPASSRRSGRRGGVALSYLDTSQSKKNRIATKNSSKKDLNDHEKGKPVDEQSRCVEKVCSIKVKQDDADKSNVGKSPNDKLISTPKENNKTEYQTKPKQSLATKTPLKGVRKQHEVDANNIIDKDSETPVRQSRRIAQQKIREEAERRKLEEIALRTMKQELKKKKKAEKQADPTVVPPTEPSSESEESDVEVKRKVQKKKCPGKNGNWSSGSEEQEEPEDDDEEPPHYETDPGSPLFKSDHEFSPESDIEDESQVVPMKRARTVRKEDGDGDSVVAVVEEEACQKCKKSDHPEWILLCDNCDKGYHCSCLSPVLFYIPEGDWYCPPCQQEQLIKALENQLKEFDDLVENKKKADEQEKLIAEEEKARKEREEEANKLKTKKDKINTNRDNGDSSAEDQSQNNDEEPLANSDVSNSSDIKKQSDKNKNRNRLRNFKNSDKRNHRDSRNNTTTRSRRNRPRKNAGDSDSDTLNSSQSSTDSKSNSSSSSSYSDSDNEPIYKLRKRRQINVSYRLNEYDDLINSALKKEMDEAAGAGNLGRGKDISTIIEADKEEKSRQKHVKDGEAGQNPKEEESDESIKEKKNSFKIEVDERNKNVKKEDNEVEEDDSDAEPIIRKFNIKPSQKKKSRKLTTLDISSEDDDGSDEDFKGSSFDDDDEEDTTISASNTDSSLEIYKRHGKLKKKRRKAARRAFRERRKDRRFVVDESDDEDLQRPKSKKKRKDDSDYTESEADEDDISELSENIDSADLCDDTTTDESDGAWRPNKRKIAKKSATSFAPKSSKPKSSTHTKKHKKVEYSDDDVSETEEDEDEDDNEGAGSGKGMGKQPRSQPLKSSSTLTKTKGKGKEKPPAKAKKKKSSEEESSKSDSEDSTRRTRGRRYAYIEDFDDDSSDGGIKPGVKRPDTPPEEREKFIKRQEEIKRMLAEKNAEGAKLAATPRLTPIKTDTEKDKRSPAKAGDSLSTVPLSVIRQAKVLDIDYLQRRGENLDDFSNEVGEVDDDFDDADLPDDLPEDMDEDAIARMVEEEENFGATAVKDLPAPDEVLRTTPPTLKSNKVKELEKPIVPGSTTSSIISSPQVTAVTLPTPTSGLQEPVRKRLPMPTMHPPLLRHQILMHDSMSSTHPLMQRHGGPHTSSHLLQNALSAPLTHSLDRHYASATSTTSHHSLINRMAHSIALQPTSSHAPNTTRPSQPQSHSVITKSPSCTGQPSQEKSTNPQIVTENKPRGRRKKITPLRDTLQKQQTAAAVTAATATNSALATSSVKNETVGTSLQSGVIKSGPGPTSKLPMQASVITSMPPTSHVSTNRAGVPIPPVTGPYVRNDGPRFYDALGTRISQVSAQRHRGPPQMPPSLLPPHPANRTSYGLPPPLKGSNSGSQVTTTSGSIRNPMRHVPPPYLGMPPNARHASHLNMYRPPIYGNPNFGPRVNLRPSNIHPSDYSTSSRAYPPYGFYPPPPPLTNPGQRSGPPSVPRPTQMPPMPSTLTHPPASVIVSATSSKSSNSSTVTLQSALPTPELNESSSNPKTVVVTQESSIKFAPAKPSSATPVIAQVEKPVTSVLTVAEPRKKLTTLQAYTANSTKQSLVLGGSDSSSRSPPDPSTELNDDSSTPGTSEIPNSTDPAMQDGKASEFSGLVSYFSSQHDDYNT